jgi:hypothetical protein
MCRDSMRMEYSFRSMTGSFAPARLIHGAVGSIRQGRIIDVVQQEDATNLGLAAILTPRNQPMVTLCFTRW